MTAANNRRCPQCNNPAVRDLGVYVPDPADGLPMGTIDLGVHLWKCANCEANWAQRSVENRMQHDLAGKEEP